MFHWMRKSGRRGPGGILGRRREADRVLQRRMILAARKLQQVQLAMGSDLAQLQELRGLLSGSDGRLERLEAGLSRTEGAVCELGQRLEQHEEALRGAVAGQAAPELFAQSEARLDELVAGLRELIDERPASGGGDDLERRLVEQGARIESLESDREELARRAGRSAPAADPDQRERQAAELEGVRVELASSLAELQLTLETYEQELRERELSPPAAEDGGFQARVESLEAELARREERIGSLQRDLARLEGTVRSLEISLEVQAQELREADVAAGAGEGADELQAELERERQRVAELEAVLREGERERIELETRHVQDMIQLADRTGERIADLERELEEREARLRDLRAGDVRPSPATEPQDSGLSRLMGAEGQAEPRPAPSEPEG